MIIIDKKGISIVPFDKILYIEIMENEDYEIELCANYDDDYTILGIYDSVIQAQRAIETIVKAYENNEKVVRL